MPAVETWQTCSREPTCSASMTSRAMIDSSATAGQPGRPSRPDTSPSCAHAVRVGQPRVLRVLGDDRVERLDVLERAAHQPGVVHAVAVVGEHPDRGAPSGPWCRSRRAVSPASPCDTAPTGRTSTSPASRAEPRHLLDDLGGVGDRVGVGHRVHGGEAAERGGRRAGRDGLGVLAARLAQVGVQVDEAGQQHQPVAVDLACRRTAGGRPRRSRRPSISTSVGRRRRAGATPVQHAGSYGDLLARRRAAGTAPPSAPTPRPGPGRGPPSAVPSAAAEEISRPRFIGPGCRTGDVVAEQVEPRRATSP